jgi:demethylmenaquinone methyltransferase/2-methoxy-6-polyprenyl-1,4-benzoquinol methylase
MQDPKFVRSAFDQIAPHYVNTNHVLSLGVDLWWRHVVAHRVADEKPQRVLDVATGSGDLLEKMSSIMPETQMIGADFSAQMLREAQKRKISLLVQADALALPFVDQSFDIVTVAFGLRNMESWSRAMQEMARVLKPGGKLMILDFSTPDQWLIKQFYLIYLRKVMPWVAGALTGERYAFDYLCQSVEAFPKGLEMEKLLKQNGFTQAQTQRLTFGIASLYVATK